MKYFYLIFLTVILFSSQIYSQIVPLDGDDKVNKEFKVDEFNVNQDVEAKLRLQFTGEESSTIVWQREVIVFNQGWQSAVCDPVTCYLPHVSSQSFSIEPQEEFDMSVHLYPNGVIGDSARIHVVMYEESKPDEEFTFSFIFQNSEISNTSDVKLNAKPSIYPNPASEFISIKNGEDVSRLEVFNLVGQMEFSQSFNAGSRIEINSLKSGMYFVKLMDANHKIIRTLRLNKQ